MDNKISDGVFFHAVIQGRDITVHLPSRATPALFGLPAGSPTFVGRDTQFAALLESLSPENDQRQPVLVSAVSGLAGVGKTELVLQVASRALREPGWFPGGALFIDLFGYDPERCLSSERALDSLLQALGLPSEHIPVDLQDRTRLYRTALAAYAEKGQRILVVIDNASSSEQARHLLPADGVTAALLTSRHTLDLGARLYDINVLDAAASVGLLRAVVRQARGETDTRVDDEPEHAQHIAEMCGHLPLALQIAAATLADTPTRPLRSLHQALADAHRRLDRLKREDRAVRAAFNLSYQVLDGDQARLFRLLPLIPGPDFSTEAAAHLADIDEPTAEDLLQSLARAHLIEPGAHWGRWRMHDLVRLYASGIIESHTIEANQAFSRVTKYYQFRLSKETSFLTAHAEIKEERIGRRNKALDWLNSEAPNLAALVSSTFTRENFQECIDIASDLTSFFLTQRKLEDWVATAKLASEAALRVQEANHAGAFNNLGLAYRSSRMFTEAIEAYSKGVAYARLVRDRHEEGKILTNLGTVLREAGQLEDSAAAHRKAVYIASVLDDKRALGMALTNLGVTLRDMKELAESVSLFSEAIDYFQEEQDPHEEACALANLAVSLNLQGELAESETTIRKARNLFHETGDRHGEAQAVMNLGNTLSSLGQHKEAAETLSTAAQMMDELGDRSALAQIKNNLGHALMRAESYTNAVRAHEEAAELFLELGEKGWEANSHHQSSHAKWVTGDKRGAIVSIRAAITCQEELEDFRIVFELRTFLGSLLVNVRELAQSAAEFQCAAELALQLEDIEGAASSYAKLGLVRQETGLLQEAADAYKESATLFRRISKTEPQIQMLASFGRALMLDGQYENAISRLEETVALQRTMKSAEQGLIIGWISICHMHLEKWEVAASKAQAAAQALSVHPEYRHEEGRALNNLGVALGKLGKTEEALTVCHRAAKILEQERDSYGLAAAWDTIAQLLESIGKSAEAANFSRKAADLSKSINLSQGDARMSNFPRNQN